MGNSRPLFKSKRCAGGRRGGGGIGKRGDAKRFHLYILFFSHQSIFTREFSKSLRAICGLKGLIKLVLAHPGGFGKRYWKGLINTGINPAGI
jgi:hypothetical protein